MEEFFDDDDDEAFVTVVMSGFGWSLGNDKGLDELKVVRDWVWFGRERK